MPDFGANLRRLMARLDLTIDRVADQTGLDSRTIKAILSGSHRPRAHTLHKLAAGLKVSTDELFQSPSLLAHRAFDRQTNSVVDDVIASHPDLFENWNEVDYDELYSRFGIGGQLTTSGTIAAAKQLNARRALHEKIAVLLETPEGDLLRDFVELLYDRVVISDEESFAE